jgi:hypothetical protein
MLQPILSLAIPGVVRQAELSRRSDEAHER